MPVSDLTPRQPVTAALIALLNAALDVPVGDHAVPKQSGTDANEGPPYVIVYAIPGERRSGPPFSNQAQADVEWSYQVTAVGVNPGYAQAVADRVTTAILGRAAGAYVNALTVAGHVVTCREFDSTSGVQASGTLSTVANRYVLYVTPS